MTFNEIIAKFTLNTTTSPHDICVEIESTHTGHCTVRFGNSFTLCVESPEDLLDLSKCIQEFVSAAHSCATICVDGEY